jgi:hypothetical protein
VGIRKPKLLRSCILDFSLLVPVRWNLLTTRNMMKIENEIARDTLVQYWNNCYSFVLVNIVTIVFLVTMEQFLSCYKLIFVCVHTQRWDFCLCTYTETSLHYAVLLKVACVCHGKFWELPYDPYKAVKEKNIFCQVDSGNDVTTRTIIERIIQSR